MTGYPFFIFVIQKVYAYTQRIYFSRQIAKAVRENIMFMWLAARQRPDFRTINRFRSERMKDVLETVFTAIWVFSSRKSTSSWSTISLTEPRSKPMPISIRLYGERQW
ncbi:transposase [Paenibacillus naphthalenovorans]